MSGVDLRELRARRDGSRLRAAVPIVVALSLAMIAWLGADPVLRSADAKHASSVGLSIATLPLDMNPRVERWMDELQTSRRAEFQALLDQSGVFEDLIRE